MAGPSDIKAWRDRLKLRKNEAAALLGMSETTYLAYEAGRNRIPHYVALACGAIAMGIPAIGDSQAKKAPAL